MQLYSLKKSMKKNKVCYNYFIILNSHMARKKPASLLYVAYYTISQARAFMCIIDFWGCAVLAAKDEERIVVTVPEENSKANTVVIVNPNSGGTSLGAGGLSITFGIIGIFVLAIIFVPLGIISGIVAVKHNQKWLGITGIFLSVIALLLSPTFWGILRLISGR